MKKNMIMVAVLVIISAVSFYGGMKYADNKNPRGQSSRLNLQDLSSEERQTRTAQFGAIGGRGARAGSGFTSGEIISKDDPAPEQARYGASKSMTVKLRGSLASGDQAGSKIIFFSASTPITKSVSGSLEDLKVGGQITANGTANPDGSLTAQSIQIRPESMPEDSRNKSR